MSRNIVLLVMDTVRKDYYDAHATEVPSKADLSFEQCLSASSWTVPSHSAMLSGNLPSVNGVHARNIDFTTLSTPHSLFGNLDGYHTVGISANGFLTPSFGFNTFFDVFTSFHGNEVLRAGGIDILSLINEYESSWKKYKKFLSASLSGGRLRDSIGNGFYMKWNDFAQGRPFPRYGDYGAQLAFEQAKTKLTEAPADKSTFLFMNVVDAHDPHEVTTAFPDKHDVPLSWYSDKHGRWEVNNSDTPADFTEYFEHYRELYGTAIEYLDSRTEEFISWVQEYLPGETTFIVTSDHGELLGYPKEDYLIEHQAGLQIPLLHVPLDIINAPPQLLGIDTTIPFSQLDIPRLIESIVTGEEFTVTEGMVPVERLGIFDPPVDRTEYWNRSIRGVYDMEMGQLYRWNSHGGAEVSSWDGPSSEEVVKDTVKIPNSHMSLFDEPLSVVAERIQEPNGQTLTDETERHLQDLGYM